MDPLLRAYLERPAPRPPLWDARYDERRGLWMFPVGAAVTGGWLVGMVVADHRGWWLPGAIVWVGIVLLGAWAGRKVHALAQAIFRHGTLARARVSSTEEQIKGEDSFLSVIVTVELDEPAGGYRDPRAGSAPSYRMTLTDRWQPWDGDKLFKAEQLLPILVSANRSRALVFIGDDAIDAIAVPVDGR